MCPGLNTGVNRGHTSSDVKKDCNESLLYPYPHAATVPNLISTSSSVGFICYPLWHNVAISGVVVSCWITLVSPGGLWWITWNKPAFVFAPC